MQVVGNVAVRGVGRGAVGDDGGREVRATLFLLLTNASGTPRRLRDSRRKRHASEDRSPLWSVNPSRRETRVTVVSIIHTVTQFSFHHVLMHTFLGV